MIREYQPLGMYDARAPVVVKCQHPAGYVVAQYSNASCNGIRFVCDTVEEAESVRKLLESEREEIEAVRRRYEMQLTAMVANHG